MIRPRKRRFTLIAPRAKPRLGDVPQRGIAFTRIWIGCLPFSIAAIAGSILLSGGDPEHRPFVIFGIGITFGVIGLLSLFVGLIQAGNVERERRRARNAARARDEKKP